MQRFAADGVRRVLYYEVHRRKMVASARERDAEGWNNHRFVIGQKPLTLTSPNKHSKKAIEK